MDDKYSNAITTMKGLAALLRRGLVIAIWTIREILKTAWSIARQPLITALNIIAALIVLFEEWGWRPLSNLLARLAKYAPIAKLEQAIASLPPYAAFVVIALPSTLLLPLKFASVWLLANGHYVTATALFVFAKIASTALIARIFILTKPALMRLEWFARGYAWFIPWKDALFEQIRASRVWRYGRILKSRIKLEAGRLWARYETPIEGVWRRWTGRSLPKFGGRSEPHA